MKPTPAQIEAARRGFVSAAKKCGKDSPDNLVTDFIISETLTAAAQVGEQKPTIGQIARTADVITKAKRDIIERCAQVAELYRDPMPDAGCCHRHKTNIAAEIRKLKDETPRHIVDKDVAPT